MLRKIKNITALLRSSVLALKSRDWILCLVSAILLIFSFPDTDFWFLAWFAFVPLFFALKDKTRLQAFLLAYLTGVIFWLGMIYWLVHVTLTGMILLVLYLSLYFGIFGLVVAITDNRQPTTEILLFPCIWVILEYIRSHLLTGFPWALLGHSQYLNLPVIQIADITGAWGVSFLLMMVNALIYSVSGALSLPGALSLSKDYRLVVSLIKKKYLLAVLSILLVLIYGNHKLQRKPNTVNRTALKISVVQGNTPREIEWDSKANEIIINRYFNLTRLALNDKPDMIIWPEAAIPLIFNEQLGFYDRLERFVKEAGKPLLLGAVRSRYNTYYNSAIFISEKGETARVYDKIHLVPFGEYIPLRNILRFLETIVPIGDFARGREYTVFNNLPVTFSVLICFEDVFPELSRRFVEKGADLLVNITNDAWFKQTSAPYQHLQSSVFRAVENRVYLVRAANTGVSAFISPAGKIISKVSDNSGKDIFIEGYHSEGIPFSKTQLSFYTRYGDLFILFCLIFVILYTIKTLIPSKQAKR